MDTTCDRPYVIAYLAVSLDGRLDGFDVDMERYYGIAARFEVDAILSGSETAVVALERYAGVANEYDDGPAPSRAKEDDPRPLFAIIDGKGRVRRWSTFQEAPYWRGSVAFLTEQVPESHRAYLASRNVDAIVLGTDRVDLSRAVSRLRDDYGVNRIRVDSGGRLNGGLLRAGLIDEVHLLVHPRLSGGQSPRSSFVADDLPLGTLGAGLERRSVETFDDGTVLLSYTITGS
jgi:2,5-diamino-6-(ribosylamino)-4(3H)-pyrimidinone 5'-phosphate reductase